MKYLVMSFDAQGRRVATESATTEAGVREVVAYAATLGAAESRVYEYRYSTTEAGDV